MNVSKNESVDKIETGKLFDSAHDFFAVAVFAVEISWRSFVCFFYQNLVTETPVRQLAALEQNLSGMK